MFRTRLISGILLVAVTIVAVLQGSYLLWGILLLVSLIGMSELYRVFAIRKSLMGILGYLTAVVYYVLVLRQQLDGLMLMAILFLILLMFIYVFTFPQFKTEQMLAAFFGLFYVAVMLSYVYRVRVLDDGVFAVWLVFLCSWGCDTCAYCVGMLIGKHKMAPKLSPKKSVEGGIGGIIGAIILGAIYAACVNHWGDAGVSILSYAIICGVGAIISQVGDLAASAIKRNHKIKDYGTLIPGHGGVLDRFDSVIFTAPIIYYMAISLMK
ncbi:MAG: phosphatidate cytidylyltransferase [Lachnospiraceae bacterium]